METANSGDAGSSYSNPYIISNATDVVTLVATNGLVQYLDVQTNTTIQVDFTNTEFDHGEIYLVTSNAANFNVAFNAIDWVGGDGRLEQNSEVTKLYGEGTNLVLATELDYDQQSFDDIVPSFNYTYSCLYQSGNGAQLISPSSAPSRFGTEDFCISMWWTAQNVSGADHLIGTCYSLSDSNYRDAWSLSIDNTGLISFRVSTAGGTVYKVLESTSPVTLAEYSLITVMRSNGSWKLLINGIVEDTTTNYIEYDISNSSNRSVYIGQGISNPTYGINNSSSWTDLRVWKTDVPTVEEIQDYYTLGIVPPQSLSYHVDSNQSGNITTITPTVGSYGVGRESYAHQFYTDPVPEPSPRTLILPYGVQTDYTYAYYRTTTFYGWFTANKAWNDFQTSDFAMMIFFEGAYNGSTADEGINTIIGKGLYPLEAGEWALSINASNNVIWYVNGSNIVESTTTVSDNTYSHIAVVRTNGIMNLYIDGLLEDSQADTNNYTTTGKFTVFETDNDKNEIATTCRWTDLWLWQSSVPSGKEIQSYYELGILPTTTPAQRWDDKDPDGDGIETSVLGGETLLSANGSYTYSSAIILPTPAPRTLGE